MATRAGRLLPFLLAAAAASCGTRTDANGLPSAGLLPAPAREGGAAGVEARRERIARIECREAEKEILPACAGGDGEAPVPVTPVVEAPPPPPPEELVVSNPKDWFERHQAADGSWSESACASCGRWSCEEHVEAGHDVGRTGLVLMVYLAEGETHRTRDHGTAVRRGLRYLKDEQDEEGCYGPRNAPRFPLDHALATLAMVEAYGRTQSPLFKGSAQNAVNFLQFQRTPGGGWREAYVAGGDDPLLTAWALSALRSARMCGLQVDEEIWSGGLNVADGIPLPAAPGGAETAESLAIDCWIRFTCGQNPENTAFLRKAEDLAEARPRAGQPAGTRLLGWTLAGWVMRNLGRTGCLIPRWGDWWGPWSEELNEATGTCLRGSDAGCAAGSADPDPGKFGATFGRLGATVLLRLLGNREIRCY